MTESKEDGLLPCPFCGGVPMLREPNMALLEWQLVWVECSSCGVQGEQFDCHVADTEDPIETVVVWAKAAWNRRASSPPVGGSGEVVAWRWRHNTLGGEKWLFSDAEPSFSPFDRETFIRDLQPLYAASVPNGVPEGWKLVPVDITEEMWTAFFKARDVTFPAQQEAAQAAGRGWNGLPAVVWEALLAASPVTPEGLSGGDWIERMDKEI